MGMFNVKHYQVYNIFQIIGIINIRKKAEIGRHNCWFHTKPCHKHEAIYRKNTIKIMLQSMLWLNLFTHNCYAVGVLPADLFRPMRGC